MSSVPHKREQRQLMSTHSCEDPGDDIELCKHHDEEGGICQRLSRSKSAKLVAMLCLIIGYFFTELVVGHITNSLTLVADSFHMLSDALSLIVALVAVRMSRRTAGDPIRPWPSKEPYFNTFGWVRFEVLGALINSTFLLALCISITLESIEKFSEPKLVDGPLLVLAVGGGGLALNIFGLVIFGSHSHGHHGHGHSHDHSHKSGNEDDEEQHSKQKVADEQHLNMRAVFLHVLGDALGSVIVMISATVLYLVPADEHPWTKYMDPTMSLILVCIMIFTTVPLFKQSSMILLQTVPRHIKLETIRNKMQKIAGIQAIHDLHIWQLAGDRIVASLHVQCANAETYLNVVQKIKISLHDEGIHSFTVQPEFSFSDDKQSPFCQMICGESCLSKTCCPQDNPKAPSERSRSSLRPTSCSTKVLDQTALTGPPMLPPTTTILMEQNEEVEDDDGLTMNVTASSHEAENLQTSSEEQDAAPTNPDEATQLITSLGYAPATHFPDVVHHQVT